MKYKEDKAFQKSGREGTGITYESTSITCGRYLCYIYGRHRFNIRKVPVGTVVTYGRYWYYIRKASVLHTEGTGITYGRHRYNIWKVLVLHKKVPVLQTVGTGIIYGRQRYCIQ